MTRISSCKERCVEREVYVGGRYGMVRSEANVERGNAQRASRLSNSDLHEIAGSTFSADTLLSYIGRGRT